MPELEKIEYEKAVAMEIDDLPYDGDGNSNNVKLLLRLAYVLGVDMSSYLDKNKQYVNDRDNFILLKEDVIIAQSKASIAESKASIARIKQEMESEREQALKNLLNAIESNGSKS
jgi:hypothetical protein